MNQSWPSKLQGQELENLTQLFKALGDPSRMKILFQIGSSEACVSEVASKLNMSESALWCHQHRCQGRISLSGCRSLVKRMP